MNGADHGHPIADGTYTILPSKTAKVNKTILAIGLLSWLVFLIFSSGASDVRICGLPVILFIGFLLVLESTRKPKIHVSRNGIAIRDVLFSRSIPADCLVRFSRGFDSEMGPTIIIRVRKGFRAEIGQPFIYRDADLLAIKNVLLTCFPNVPFDS